MTIDEVLREMRWCQQYPIAQGWADAIEAAMREKDAEVEAAREWLRGHAEIEKAKSAEIDQWRTTGQNLLEQMLDETKQNERLRTLLAEARDDIRESVENEYPPDLRRYPSEMRRYQAGMDIVHRIEAALATDPTA